MRNRKELFKLYGPFFLAGLILMWIPLIGDLHVESAVLSSLFGAFFAGVLAARKKESPGDLTHMLRVQTQVYTIAIPLAIKCALSGCLSADGIGFWVFFPSMSVFFGYSIGRLFRINGFRHAVLWTVLVLLLIGLGEFLVELFTLPQVYFFNHVWGGWPGPLYDSAVRFTTQDLFFRFVTFCWAALLWLLPSFWHQRFAKWGVLVLTVSLGLSYAQMPFVHIITPRWYLKQVLSGRVEGQNVVIYYDPSRYSTYDIHKYLDKAEFDVSEICHDLKIQPPTGRNRVECFFYGDVWQKKELVGAKYTSYVPVWNPVNQVHIAKSAIDQVLRHELVHVLAKQFGGPILNASWSIGLTEGLAVSLAPDESEYATIDQIVAASKPWPSARDIENALSFSGFYEGRANVSYITAGSFVHYLLDKWPVSDFKKAYRSSDLADGYPVSVDSLVAGWHAALEKIPVDSTDMAVSAHLFSIPSIFEKKCPHKLTRAYYYYDSYDHSMALYDTTKAVQTLNTALSKLPWKPSFWIPWSTLQLITGHPDTVLKSYIPPKLTDPLVAIRMADSYMMANDSVRADRDLDSALVMSTGTRLLGRILFRKHSRRNWVDYLKILNGSYAVTDSSDFELLAPANRLFALSYMITKEETKAVLKLGSGVVGYPFQKYYFETYMDLIDYLAVHGNINQARNVLSFLKEEPSLRLRWKQMIGRKERFLVFMNEHRNLNMLKYSRNRR
ncbi:MAG TPA: hypothetical protein VKA08_13635 [Balneolales bacterium]|nr:hypothetical protein [Balneolales bacterium]